MTCYHCHWGWSKPVNAIYSKYLKLLNGNDMALDYGPAHIVWADENMETDHIQWCIEGAESWTKEWNKGKFTQDEINLVIASLRELIVVPEHLRVPPTEYEKLVDEVDWNLPQDQRKEPHPKDFPPPEGWL